MQLVKAVRATFMSRPGFVVKYGSSVGTREYHTQDGGLKYVATTRKPWRYRSTIHDSPMWGVRTGSAVISERRRFSNKWWHNRRNRRLVSRLRLGQLIFSRCKHIRFYPGRYSRWD